MKNIYLNIDYEPDVGDNDTDIKGIYVFIDKIEDFTKKSNLKHDINIEKFLPKIDIKNLSYNRELFFKTIRDVERALAELNTDFSFNIIINIITMMYSIFFKDNQVNYEYLKVFIKLIIQANQFEQINSMN